MSDATKMRVPTKGFQIYFNRTIGQLLLASSLDHGVSSNLLTRPER
jgi:hypothetical protein